MTDGSSSVINFSYLVSFNSFTKCDFKIQVSTGEESAVYIVPVNGVKAWDVSSHYFSKLIHIKLFIFSKLFQDTYNVTKNNVINRARIEKKKLSEH